MEADPDVIISGFLGQVARVRVPPPGGAPKCREDPTADQVDIANQPGDVQPQPVAPPEARPHGQILNRSPGHVA